MEELYAPFLAAKIPFIWTNLETAEMIKYASNAFLTKLSFVNELAALCETVGADLPTVTRGMGLDHRIGPHFSPPALAMAGPVSRRIQKP